MSRTPRSDEPTASRCRFRCLRPHWFRVWASSLLCLTFVHAWLPVAWAVNQEGTALLELRSSLITASNRTTNWDASNATPCNWEGVTCNKNGTYVLALSLASFFLGGQLNSLAQLAILSRLLKLDISSNNLSGPIPPELGLLLNLNKIILRANALSGPIPPELGQLRSLSYLDLSNNNLSGLIPPALGNCYKLSLLHLGNNGLEGPIPSTLWNLQQLSFLRLSNNYLDFLPPGLSRLGNLKGLWLHSNRFAGSIPEELGLLPYLKNLNLGGNSWTPGRFPPWIQNLVQLQLLSLNSSNITGPIPNWLGDLPIIDLNLSYNPGLDTATLPSLLNTLKFRSLELSGIGLSGPIPLELRNQSQLVLLTLANNTLSGSIPAWLSEATPLLSFLRLEGNQLSGSIPREVGAWSYMLKFKVSHNNLTGAIPEEMGEWVSAPEHVFVEQIDAGERHFFLDHNQLSGTVPEAVAALPSLRSLWVNDNELMGLIPGTLLSKPAGFDGQFARNFFWGRALPENVSQDRVEGNCFGYTVSSGLNSPLLPGQRSAQECAAEYNRPPPTPPAPAENAPPLVQPSPPLGASSRPLRSSTIAGVTAGSTVLLLTCCMLAAFFFWRRRTGAADKDKEADVCASKRQPFKFSPKIGPREFLPSDLRAATGNFAEENILGAGGGGTVFQGKLGDGGQVAVKVLQAGPHSMQEFVTEVELISTVHNRHITRLQGYCVDEERYMLVYELMPGGSLQDALFHPTKCLSLSWDQTGAIMQGTAAGLAYLHEACVQKIIHRDVKPGNILLDGDLQACIGDFGIAKRAERDDSEIATAAVRGTSAYIAPEYRMLGRLTEKSDVYSFGMTMLVAATRAQPHWQLADPRGGRASIGLQEFVRAALEAGDARRAIFAAYQEQCSEGEAAEYFTVALHCLSHEPTARPRMALVQQMLEGGAPVPPLGARLVVELLSDTTGSTDSRSNESGLTNSLPSNGAFLYLPKPR